MLILPFNVLLLSKYRKVCEIAGFRRGLVEVFTPLGCWRDIDSKLVTDVSGQHIDPVPYGLAVQEDCLTLNGGIDKLSRNVCNQVPTYAMKHPRREKTSI
jgi:hypothetical protein